MSLGIHWGLGIGGRTAQGHTGMGGGRCHVHRPRLARTRSGTYLAPPPPKAPTYTAESLCPVVAFPGLSENRGIHNSRGKSHSRAGFSNIRRATWWMGDDNSFFIGDGTMKIIIISWAERYRWGERSTNTEAFSPEPRHHSAFCQRIRPPSKQELSSHYLPLTCSFRI